MLPNLHNRQGYQTIQFFRFISCLNRHQIFTEPFRECTIVHKQPESENHLGMA